jgi:hypothetical protein
MTTEINRPPHWWGSFIFPLQQNLQWHIGPLTLIVRYLDGEWHIGHQRTDDFDSDDSIWEVHNTDQLPETLENNSRYIFSKMVKRLTVTPRLADRPIISRPRIPFNLTAGEEVTLYVSSPLWLELALGTSPETVLEEVAIQRPSDTWFGPSTLEGELCYASTTHCRINLAELPQRAHRAITPVLIRNQADTTLTVERLNLPAPLLSIYACTDGQLWTPKVTLIRGKDGDMAELKIDSKAPEQSESPELLSKPRNTANNGVLIRAFNAVFS